MQKWKILLTGLLALGVIYAAGSTVWQARQPLVQTWKAIGQAAVWRGVNFSAGQDFANYVTFLNQVIPADALVVLPPEGIGPPAMGRTPYMQFFLAPRRVANCTEDVDRCAANFSQSGAYVLIARRDGFPSTGVLQNQAQTQIFNEQAGLGVYLPAGSQPADLPLQGNASLLAIAVKLLGPLVWLGILAASGALVVHSLAKGIHPLGRAALGFGLGIGMYTLVLYLALLSGIALSPTLILSITVILAALGGGIYLLTRRGAPARGESPPPSIQFTWIDVLYLALFGGAALLAGMLAVGQGYHCRWAVAGGFRVGHAHHQLPVAPAAEHCLFPGPVWRRAARVENHLSCILFQPAFADLYLFAPVDPKLHRAT
jgi:hypothetical protein